jgi:UDP-glucose 4-epimerase
LKARLVSTLVSEKTGFKICFPNASNLYHYAAGKEIPMKIVARRPGDAAEVYGATGKAKEVLGWEAKYSIEEACKDQWKWASENPYGYGKAE